MPRFAYSILAVTTAAVLTCAADAAWADSSCADGRFCIWKQTDYEGDKRTFGADAAEVDRALSDWDRSAKNRFNSRRVLIKDSSGDVVDCLNPGSSDPNLPASANQFRIGGTGSSC